MYVKSKNASQEETPVDKDVLSESSVKQHDILYMQLRATLCTRNGDTSIATGFSDIRMFQYQRDIYMIVSSRDGSLSCQGQVAVTQCCHYFPLSFMMEILSVVSFVPSIITLTAKDNPLDSL